MNIVYLISKFHLYPLDSGIEVTRVLIVLRYDCIYIRNCYRITSPPPSLTDGLRESKENDLPSKGELRRGEKE